MEKQAQNGRDSSVGLVLLDARGRPFYASAEAVRVLIYPEEPAENISLDGCLAERIRPVVRNHEESSAVPSQQELISGRRRYVCRFFVLELGLGNSHAPTLAVLIERNLSSSWLVASMAKEFHLTSREKEALGLLLEGLTGKEIAARMRISPNTVKAFLRLVMIKMGVSNRAGIVARILRP